MEDAELRKKGEYLFTKHVLDDAELKKEYDQWLDVAKKLKEMEDKLNKGISGMSDKDLAEFLKEWNKVHINFWLTGFLPELSNWGGELMLKRKLLKFDRKNFIEIFEKLSAPEEVSFFEKEQLELMRMKLMGPVEREKQFAVHQMRYYWIANSYCTTRVLDEDWFRKQLSEISEEEARRRIEEIESYAENVKEDKKEVIEKYSIPEDIVNIADKLAYCVGWQDYRKTYIFIANHMITQFVREISRRNAIDFKELCYYTTEEIEELAEKGYKADVKQRFEGFAEYYTERSGISYFEGREAQDLARPYVEIDFDPGMKEFKGIVVSTGNRIKAKARVMMKPEPESMEKGEVLIAPMTSPDYVVAMRKAGAIVTDTGGMTCHAAIVSRELDVPCIVNTKFATKTISTGDIIEVDTKKGIVRKVDQ
ncbi:hypothetical protein GF345_02140 [Candidatus Woesearchaeota archaeon]|nr:hypothetical protein [Candidatus Woesearchaeota archaeon]